MKIELSAAETKLLLDALVAHDVYVLAQDPTAARERAAVRALSARLGKRLVTVAGSTPGECDSCGMAAPFFRGTCGDCHKMNETKSARD